MVPTCSESDASNEAALVSRAQAGDLEAFEPLVDGYLPEIRAFIALRAPAAYLIDELAHETFVFAFRNLRDFARGTSLRSWLRSIAWNLLRAEILRFSREQANKLRYAEARRLELTEAQLVAARGETEFLWECVERLPGGMRRLLELKYQAEHSTEEIANQVQRTAEWVRTMLFRVRQQLKACIEGKAGRVEGKEPC